MCLQAVSPGTRCFALEPTDFWTRISHVIEMRHPLDLEDDKQRVFVLQEYFQMFGTDMCRIILVTSKGLDAFHLPKRRPPPKIQE